MKRAFIMLAALPLLMGTSAPPTLDVTVSGIRNMRGNVLACLWRDKVGFPTCQKATSAIKQTQRVTGAVMHFKFPALAPGVYAVTAHHDEDGDGKLKTNFIGMPKEGVGVSNNPGGMPGWSKSLVRVLGNGAITVNLRYL